MRVPSVEEICQLTDEILAELKSPSLAPVDFFKMEHMWSLEIRGTLRGMVDHWRAIVLSVQQDLGRPAMALSRSVHEACVRFDYITDHPYELRSWIEWGLASEYHTYRDRLRYDARDDPDRQAGAQWHMDHIEPLIGKSPKRPPFPWRPLRHMTEVIAGHHPDNFHRRMHRILQQEPSAYVHIRLTPEPIPEIVLFLTEVSLVETIRKAMDLIVEMDLTPALSHERARKVAGLCQSWMEAEASAAQS